MDIEVIEAVWVEERRTVSTAELLEIAGLSEGELRDLVDLGALTPIGGHTPDWIFGGNAIITVQTARRLRDDFELDSHGLSVALSLMERIRELESQLRLVRARLPAGSPSDASEA